MNLRSIKSALLLGAINGLIFGIAYQPVSNAFLEYENNRPSIIPIHSVKLFPPVVEYLFLILLFTLASYTVHRFFKAKIKSDIMLWIVVAIVAMGVPTICLYLIEKVGGLVGAYRVKLQRGEWGYVPSIAPDGNDIEFAILFFHLAIAINFVFGVIIALLSKRFVKR